jgi:formiminoglutamase
MQTFRRYNKQDILTLTRIRRYETKLGERIKVAGPGALKDEVERSSAGFVLFGVPEDIGVKANLGMAGTASLWWSFLKAFLNIQSTDLLDGSDILVLGHFDFQELDGLIEQKARHTEEKVDAWRHAVANVIDPAVEELCLLIAQAGTIPVCIGGGHNNAYPIIKGVAKAMQKKNGGESVIPVVNLDAHADFRITEGRHSGNAFRYAMEEGYLSAYAVIGLHENYNSQSMLDDLQSHDRVHYSFFEDIFIREKFSFRQAMVDAFNFTGDTRTGIELDLDSIAGVLSSALTPSGVSVNDARQFIHYAAQMGHAAYLHVCEGAAHLSNGDKDDSTGKLVSYLLSDFLKGYHP